MVFSSDFSSPSPHGRPMASSQPSSPTHPVVFDDADDFLSSDLDISFASTMSITSAPNSPTAGQDMFLDQMDMSPAVDAFSEQPSDTSQYFSSNLNPSATSRGFGTEVSNSPTIQLGKTVPAARNRSHTLLPPIRRPELSRPTLTAATSNSLKSSSSRSRNTLPDAWLQEPEPAKASTRSKRNGAVFTQQAPIIPSSSVPNGSDAMDLDVPSPAPRHYQEAILFTSSPAPSSPVPNQDLSHLFFHPSSPESSPPAPVAAPAPIAGSKKRRSPDPEEHTARQYPSRPKPTGVFQSSFGKDIQDKQRLMSSSPPPSSPSYKRARPHPFERTSTTGGHGTLFSNVSLRSSSPAAPLQSQVLPKRPMPRRPALSAIIAPTRGSSASAFLTSRPSSAIGFGAPARRTVSAALPPRPTASFVSNGPSSGSEAQATDTEDEDDGIDVVRDDDEYDNEIGGSSFEIDMSSPAQRAQIARRENIGRMGKRAATAASSSAKLGMMMGLNGSRVSGPSPLKFGGPLAAAATITSSGPSVKKAAPALSGGFGLPGFGDSEADGKVLPCHKVRDDGLMRITHDTLEDLLNGHYNQDIESYTVIDCRFDYEHNGGHIPGAINLYTNEAIEEFLLGPSKPPPSRSGDSLGPKRVLVFHCEFSMKRAPTFAKHLRQKDRLLNGHVYPNVHYPEVYVLEGGYSGYYHARPDRCVPSAYVRMDDPAYQRNRATDLNDFRRWNRTRSFTYGEQQRAAASGPAASNAGASTRPVSTDTGSKGGLHFAAANAALGRRHNSASAAQGSSANTMFGMAGLSTLQEDGDSSCASEADPVGDSPCPPTRPNGMLLGNGMQIGQQGRPRPMYRAATTMIVGGRR